MEFINTWIPDFSSNSDINTSKNDLTNINSNESLTSQFRQIYSAPAIDTRANMFGSQDSDEKCFQIIYPISLTFPDGSEITINNDEDWDEIDLWYEENKDSDEGPEIKYPFFISLNGSTFEVNNDVDFLELLSGEVLELSLVRIAEPTIQRRLAKAVLGVV